MNLAWKELLYSKKKYLLIELIIILLMFMVLFLSGLVNGLGRSVSSGIELMDGAYFVVSDSAEDIITVSSLDETVLDEVKAQVSCDVTTLDIQRMYMETRDSEEKLNITYFAIEEGSFLEPEIMEGTSLAEAKVENPIILADDFQMDGIELGDTMIDSSTDMEFTVVGFAKDQMYGHTSIGFISTESYTELRSALNPMYEVQYHAIVIQDEDGADVIVEGTQVDDKSTIIENIPSYTAEHMTITMVIWLLVVISAVIIGVFYYILTLQKEKQFAVMKSLGVSMGSISGMIISQVGIVACFGAVVSNVLTLAMSAALPQTMPYYLTGESECIVSVAFVLISVLSSLLSVSRISRVDPMTVIGGEQ